ncbi:MAG: bifunctional riboflavin kinase/FAD synthetase [Anaplasma sp.]
MKVLYGCEGEGPVALSFGNFDGVHLGHVRIFAELTQRARAISLPSAALTFLPHTAVFLRKCENFLLVDFEQKAELIKACGVDYLHVVEFGPEFAQLSPEEFVVDVLIKGCKAQHIVVGENCSFGRGCSGNLAVLKQCAEAAGCGVTEVQQYAVESKVCSSSSIRDCLRRGNVETASALLGRRHVISGKVIRGRGRGRLIGFPTLNLSMGHTVLPRSGVYHARAKLSETNHWLSGVVNIGVRPTFAEDESSILEMHIFDFDRDIYGEKVSVELVNFIRSEHKFKNVDQLVEQIRKDISKVKLKYCPQ